MQRERRRGAVRMQGKGEEDVRKYGERKGDVRMQREEGSIRKQGRERCKEEVNGRQGEGEM